MTLLMNHILTFSIFSSLLSLRRSSSSHSDIGHQSSLPELQVRLLFLALIARNFLLNFLWTCPRRAIGFSPRAKSSLAQFSQLLCPAASHPRGISFMSSPLMRSP